MKIFQVWHADPPAYDICFDKNKEERVAKIRTEFPKGYHLVAHVEGEGLEDVFRSTNTIEELWTRNAEILKLYGTRHRSTSVGDVVIDGNQRWLCDGNGWVDL